MPEGRWTDFLTGRVLTGPRWVNEAHGFLSLPLLVRPGSVIPVGDTDDRPGYDYADGVTFQVYEVADGATMSALVPTREGVEALALEVTRQGRTVTANVRGEGDWRLLRVGVTRVESVEGGAAETTDSGALIRPTAGTSSIVIMLAGIGD